MPPATFSTELAQYGPRRGAPAVGIAEAEAYCRRLACTHYENFTVASRLLPARLRQHFYNVYAYCRWADDLADETGDPEQSLELLDWWQHQLDECYQGRATHPVFVALAGTVRQFNIPREPFADLLVAFRQDQHQQRYATFDELLRYCRNSANPVGRLVLYLGECHDEQRGALSDSVCTGLQLANFWQDVARDYERGRVYLPRESMRQFDCDDAALARRTADAPFKRLLAYEVDRAQQWLRAGLPLVEQVPKWLSADVWLFIHGGLKILEHIRRIDYDVWRRRPEVSKLDKARLLLGFAWQRLRGPVGAA